MRTAKVHQLLAWIEDGLDVLLDRIPIRAYPFYSLDHKTHRRYDHKEHGVPLNKLYAASARRVGCFPCVISRKSEMRNITLNFQDRITKIMEEEKRHWASGRISTFFHARTVPPRFRKTVLTDASWKTHVVASIQDVSEWILPGKRAKGNLSGQPRRFRPSV